MPTQPAYFDSQASAAAILKIDIYKLRAAKREGCLAFRSGRVYRDELLSWFEEKEQRKAEKAANDLENEEPQYIAARTLMGLHQFANLKLISPEQHFKCCKTIVEAVNDEEVFVLFLRTMYDWLLGQFWKEGETQEQAFLAASNVYPQIVKWLFKGANALSTPKSKSVD